MSQNSLFDSCCEECIRLDDHCELLYIPSWLTGDQAANVFSELLDCTPWQQPEIVVAGKVHKIPRLQAWYGDKGAVMEYSGKRFTPNHWTRLLADLRAAAEKSANTEFNSVLVNQYRSGRDSVSWHADDEKELGLNPVIGSLSLGGTRVFSLKSRATGEVVKQNLHHGDFLVMRGETQHRWLHAVTKVKHAVDIRINLTFRKIVFKSRTM